MTPVHLIETRNKFKIVQIPKEKKAIIIAELEEWGNARVKASDQECDSILNYYRDVSPPGYLIEVYKEWQDKETGQCSRSLWKTGMSSTVEEGAVIKLSFVDKIKQLSKKREEEIKKDIIDNAIELIKQQIENVAHSGMFVTRYGVDRGEKKYIDEIVCKIEELGFQCIYRTFENDLKITW